MAFRADPTTTRWGEGMQRPRRPPGEDLGGYAARKGGPPPGGGERRAERGPGRAPPPPDRRRAGRPPAVPPLLDREGRRDGDEEDRVQEQPVRELVPRVGAERLQRDEGDD